MFNKLLSATMLASIAAGASPQIRDNSVGQDVNCVSSVAVVLESFPTPPPKIASQAVRLTGLDCTFTCSPSLSSDFSSYSSTVVSWISKNDKSLKTLQSQCSDALPTSILGDACWAAVGAQATSTSTKSGTLAISPALSSGATGSAAKTTISPGAAGTPSANYIALFAAGAALAL